MTNRRLEMVRHPFQVSEDLDQPIPLVIFQDLVLARLRRFPLFDDGAALPVEGRMKPEWLEPVRAHVDAVEVDRVRSVSGVVRVRGMPPALNRVSQHFFPGMTLFQQHHVEGTVRVELLVPLELHRLNDIREMKSRCPVPAGIAQTQIRIRVEPGDLHAPVCVVSVALRACLFLTATIAAARADSAVH